MKVLLITTDLYRNIGGGQTVYRRLVESAPGIQFTYFRDSEPDGAVRPPNTSAVRLPIRLKLKATGPPPFPAFKLAHLQEADRFARAVAGESFDVVDIPDFYTFGSLLRDAFAHHGVKVGRIVLAMHGNISPSLEMAWGSPGDNVLEQRMLEKEQFASADGVYAISTRYMREWRAAIDRPVHYIDPLAFVQRPRLENLEWSQPSGRPRLYCIGRTERRKGNDLFIELVRWLDRSLYDGAAHIGDEMTAAWGVSTRHILHDIAKKRDLEFEFRPSYSYDQLQRLYRESSMVVLPVRYDTLNLVALEALFAGCPVAISSEAGVCDYLDMTYPGLPYVKIDFSNIYESVAAIEDVLRHYDAYRANLRDCLGRLAPRTSLQPEIDVFYRRVRDAASTAVSTGAVRMPYYESGQTLPARIGRIAKKVLPVDRYDELARMLRQPREYFLRKLKESEYFGDARYVDTTFDAARVPSRLRRIAAHSEYNLARLREKLNELYGACSNPLYRCNFWLDIARIERTLGNDLVAVTYELRALRLVGHDAFSMLPRVVGTLQAKGFPLEAMAARALYDVSGASPANVREFLDSRYKANRTKAVQPFERVDDRRSGSPRVAVIVSLYRAASKLRLFLTMIARQTLARAGAVEVIFIDSGSPDCEQDVLAAFWSAEPLNAVYARSERRETIQAAWNRGIQLARAPYLVFLGVDETLYPDALEALAGELDRESTVDWVMANSLVTAVDGRGVFKNDVMTYDRSGGTKDHVYLETCYLSWVGGMYRRSIHDRYGYYDETFGAAGDTEFKNRILPHIRVKFVPRALGLFLNYPDERTTASPRAEVEDLRAWYVHRSPGGVDYAFGARPVADAIQLLAAALSYRKSYCTHTSTDIEYAWCLDRHIRARSPGALPDQRPLDGLLSDLRALEYTTTPPKAIHCARQLIDTWRRARRAHGFVAAGGGDALPHYRILNDNRYEQHSWLWRTT